MRRVRPDEHATVDAHAPAIGHVATQSGADHARQHPVRASSRVVTRSVSSIGTSRVAALVCRRLNGAYPLAEQFGIGMGEAPGVPEGVEAVEALDVPTEVPADGIELRSGADLEPGAAAVLEAGG